MNIDKSVLKRHIFIVIFFIIIGLVSDFNITGTFLLITGALDIAAGLISLISGKQLLAKTLLLCGGVILIIGVSTCSFSPQIRI